MGIAACSQEAFQRVADDGAFIVAFWAGADPATHVPVAYADAVREIGPDIHAYQFIVPEQQALAAMFGVADVPALTIMRERVVLYHAPGLPDVGAFVALVTRAGGLDMAMVRDELRHAAEAEAALHVRRVCPTARRTR